MNSHAATLAELSQQLLACADEALLDAPLDSLDRRVSDADVRELLRNVHESGDADCLRDFLARESLARWALDEATPTEQAALAAELRRWLGIGRTSSEGARGSDDPARLAELRPLPQELEALLAWARPYEVLDELIRPVSEVVAEAATLPDTSLAEACLGRFSPAAAGGSALGRARVVDRARDYLQARAALAAALRARTALWQREPPPPLQLLHTRLRATIGGTTLARLHEVGFVPVRPVAVDPDSGLCRGQLRAQGEPSSHGARLLLGGYEQRALHGECECAATPTMTARGGAGSAAATECLHLRALAARLVDACLDPGDRLHAALLEFVSEPSWKRFVRALASDAPDEAADADRLGFRVRIDGDRASVGVYVHKPLQDGRWTAGKLVSPHKLARSGVRAERDRPVLELMSATSRTLGAHYVPADLALLRALVEHPYVELEVEDGSRSGLRVAEQTVQLQLLELPEGLLPKLTLGGLPVPPGPRRREQSYLLAHDRGAGVLVIAALTPPVRRLLGALGAFHGVLPPESYAALAPWLSSMRQVAQVATPPALRGHERATPRKLLLRITPRLDQGVDVLLAIRALPLAPLWPPAGGPELVDGLESGKAVHARRDLDWERTIAEHVIEELGLGEHTRIEAFGYRIESTQAALALLSAAARLHDLLEIEWAENARKLRLTTTLRTGDLKVDLAQHGSWISVGGAAVGPGAEIALRRLLDAVRLGERFVQVSGDDYAEIERELFERLERAQLCVLDPLRDPLIGRGALPFWLDQLGGQTIATDAATQRWIERLRSQPPAASDLPPIDPAWQARLRDYQQHGLAWLLASSRWAEGVCLADEMGLGKTVQTIGLLVARASLGPALVVAPTSVVHNWQSELARFAPELEVRLYRGAHRRERLAGLGPSVVVLTSYELLLRDRDAFEGRSFATQVVDEAQTIRNARTRRARAVAGIAAEFRVALTGTPIENRLGDLWSFFALIAPGLLGSWQRFRARFAVPIERYEDAERAELLRALVAPFILRRTKREVARELPSRTEVVHWVELSPAEQALYASAARHAKRAFGRRRRSPDDTTPVVQILAELTRLRQLACHPRLVIDDARVGSSKLAALMQLLQDILPRGHRVLIFSQFVQHLTLVRAALDAAAISFVYLDGSTPAAERAELVARFQREEAQAFLISLKAGGTGLNLTAADYVVHLDPWWNPAAEDQASDRAHRVGQVRPVTIVRLVSQGTIEEKVLGLHSHKRRLADAALTGDAPVATLDAAALEALL